MSDTDPIDTFLAHGPFAVVGASRDRAKFGNKVLRAYLDHGLEAIPVHPTEPEVEGRTAYPSLRDLPEPVVSASVITPPAVTERVVEDAAAAGIETLWLQPGAESIPAMKAAREHGIRVIAGGACVLVELPRRVSQ